MGVATSERVWKQSGHAGTELLMLLAVADHINDAAPERGAWPAISTLAMRCRVSERQAKRLLAALRDSGELVSDQRPGGSSVYRLGVLRGRQGVTPVTPPGDAHDTPGGDADDTTGMTPVAPKSEVNQKTEPEANQIGGDKRRRSGFDVLRQAGVTEDRIDGLVEQQRLKGWYTIPGADAEHLVEQVRIAGSDINEVIDRFIEGVFTSPANFKAEWLQDRTRRMVPRQSATQAAHMKPSAQAQAISKLGAMKSPAQARAEDVALQAATPNQDSEVDHAHF